MVNMPTRDRPPTGWLTAADAAARLAVKPATLYAYVSRGLITRRVGPDGRSSRYDAGDVEALARRGRPRRSSRDPAVEIVVASSVTEIPAGRAQRFGHRYRGQRAVVLASTMPFETAAGWVLDGGGPLPIRLPTERGDATGWSDSDVLVTIRSALDAVAVQDPRRRDLSTESVRRAAADIISTAVDAVGARHRKSVAALRLDDGTTHRSTVAAHLADVLGSGHRPQPWVIEAINAALVLLVDHELATSSLAARVAASTRADPYACVIAALATLSGPLHGTASSAVRVALDAEDPLDRLTRSATGSIPIGFGHPVYAGIDPRAAELLRRVESGAPDSPIVGVARGLVRSVERRTGVPPNVDWGLAVLCNAAGLRADAGEVIFAVARCAGWLAHIVEEYESVPLRYRSRAVFGRD